MLNSDPKVIQQLEFIYKSSAEVDADIVIVLKKEKQTRLEFSNGTVKFY